MKKSALVLVTVILLLSLFSVLTSLKFSYEYEYCKAGGDPKKCAPMEGYGILMLVSFVVIILCSWIIYKERLEEALSQV